MKCRVPRRILHGNEQGSVLIVVIGILILLLLLTVSVGRRANQELNLVKYSLQKMQARYLAWAGFHYALTMVREDGLDEKSSLYDDQFACGLKVTEDRTAESAFKEVKLGNGFFAVTTPGEPARYGLGDEDGKLNLNAINLQNYGVLKELLIVAGISDENASTMASDALDWRDEDSEPARGVLTDRGDEHEGPFLFDKKEFRAKNRPFDQVYELMFIKGITPAVYEKIKNVVTVFPRRTEGLKVNLATASADVLLALARYSSGPATGTSRDDADSLVEKILRFRAGGDRVEGTFDDQQITETKMGLTMSEQIIFRAMAVSETKTSRFLSFRVSGFEGANRRQSHIDAVVDRQTLTVVSWRNN